MMIRKLAPLFCLAILVGCSSMPRTKSAENLKTDPYYEEIEFPVKRLSTGRTRDGSLADPERARLSKAQPEAQSQGESEQ